MPPCGKMEHSGEFHLVCITISNVGVVNFVQSPFVTIKLKPAPQSAYILLFRESHCLLRNYIWQCDSPIQAENCVRLCVVC